MRDKEVHLPRSGDLILCPVQAWAVITRKIGHYPGTCDDTPICMTYRDGELHLITRYKLKTALITAAEIISEAKFGFKPTELKTHSLHLGVAMAMYLDIFVYTIMIIGCWSSDAFLRYIRKQVEQFSQNVSARMIKYQHFSHVPALRLQVDHHDICQ